MKAKLGISRGLYRFIFVFPLMTEAAELSYILSSRTMSGGPWILSALNGQGMARQSV